MNEFEVIRYPQMNGLNIFFDTVDYRTPHVHPDWELILLLENALSVTCNQNTYRVEPGEILLFSPNQPHEFHRAGESCTFLCLQISPQVVAQVFPAVERLTVDGLFLRRRRTMTGQKKRSCSLWEPTFAGIPVTSCTAWGRG